jgi:hypothetical protein
VKLTFSPLLNGSVSPPVTVFTNPESTFETLLRSGETTPLISIARIPILVELAAVTSIVTELPEVEVVLFW